MFIPIKQSNLPLHNQLIDTIEELKILKFFIGISCFKKIFSISKLELFTCSEIKLFSKYFLFDTLILWSFKKAPFPSSVK